MTQTYGYCIKSLTGKYKGFKSVSIVMEAERFTMFTMECKQMKTWKKHSQMVT